MNSDSTIYITSFKDVTRQKTAERENKGQQALTSGVINSIPDMVVYKDLRGVYLGCNDAYTAITGCPSRRSSAVRRTSCSRQTAPP